MRHQVITHTSSSSAFSPVNLSTNCDRISGVIGSFFTVLWAKIRLAPARTCLTNSDCVGSSAHAIWCAQDIALTASSIGELVEDFVIS